jgi:hypothetical protein
MGSSSSRRRRPSVRITSQRASRLLRLVRFLAEAPRGRMAILSELRIGLRTFYRELELLRRCGVKVRQESKLYSLSATAAINSSGRALSAELEWLRVEDSRGSMARDYADDDAGRPSPPPSASEAFGRAPTKPP